MGNYLRSPSTKILLVTTILILLSTPIVFCVPITPDANVDIVRTESSIPKPPTNLEIFRPESELKLRTMPRTRSARQSNYPFMIYGGCSPPGQTGWGWNPRPPRYLRRTTQWEAKRDLRLRGIHCLRPQLKDLKHLKFVYIYTVNILFIAGAIIQNGQWNIYPSCTEIF
ncbi:uncharacterized protein LOC118439145 [Folsomia candida]|uniref:uncharacterized protein LOC118439145 n=1 Tax=Folsomia candida TaxID=158441 RepID=UPI0016055AC5|nr:uncharacterized protein LOC118439145 [Folsomia candida]